MNKLMIKAMIGSVLALVSAQACGSASDAAQSEALTGARLELGARGGSSGALYRLGHGTFVIEGLDGALAEPLRIQASGAQEPALDVPLQPGSYQVQLEPGWTLEASLRGSPFYAVDATLLSQNPLPFYVYELDSARVRFEFALGESELELGLSVDEGYRLPIPDGYDGIVLPTEFGDYEILFREGFSACCYSSPEDAQSAYSWSNLYVWQSEADAGT